jgi:predicted XRE-type DNA-binding protein
VTDNAKKQVIQLRVQLMNHVKKVVQEEGWTQAEAAEYLGVAQSRVSDLLNSKSDKFSLDMLISLASRVGCKIGLAIK